MTSARERKRDIVGEWEMIYLEREMRYLKYDESEGDKYREEREEGSKKEKDAQKERDVDKSKIDRETKIVRNRVRQKERQREREGRTYTHT